VFETLDESVPQDPLLPPRTKFDSREVTWIERVEECVPESVDLSRVYMARDSGATLQWPECPWYWQEQHLLWGIW